MLRFFPFQISLVLWLLSATFASAQTPEQELLLEGKVEDNLRFSCGFHRAVAAAASSEKFQKELQTTNFDPCCLGPPILQELSSNKATLKGITMGTSTGVKYYFGGKEFVIFYEKGRNLKVAVFKHVGFSAALGLPYGSVVTSGIIFGSCPTIKSYSGYFKTEEVAGYTWNFGMDGSFLERPEQSGFAGFKKRFTNHIYARQTGCNSKTLNTGLTTAILGLSGSYYELISPIVTIRGDRTRKMQNLFRRASGDAEIRNFPDQAQGRTPMNFEKFHMKTCSYDIPAQAWDNLSVKPLLENLSTKFPPGTNP